MPLLLDASPCDQHQLPLGAAGDATPRKERHAMDDFLSILAALSRVHGSRTPTRRGSCSASPSCGTPASDLADDLSCLPPEEPEWLYMVNAAAARARSRGGSRCGSRRSSGAPYAVAPSRLGPQQQLTAQALSPLRFSSGALPNYPRLGSGESSAAGGLRTRLSSSRPPHHHHHLARGSEFTSACDSAAGEPGCSGGSSVTDGCDADSSDGSTGSLGSAVPTASAMSAGGAGCGEEERLALYCADEDSDPIMAGAPAAAVYLYELLGSWEVVTAAVDTLYRRIMDDAVVSGFFQGVPELRARHHMVAIVAMAFMGREAASDEWLGAMQRQLVRDHGLGTTHLAILMDLVEAALRSLGVEEDMAGSALGMLTSRRSGSGAANGTEKAPASKEA